MLVEREIKYRVEHRSGYESYNWQVDVISQLMLHIHGIGLNIFEITPPYYVLNSILSNGRSDAGMSGLVVWEATTLTIEEYNNTKQNLLNHPEMEYYYDKEFSQIENPEKWLNKIFHKYGTTPIDASKIITYLKSKKIKGLKQCISKARQITFHYSQKNKWHRTKHVTEAEIDTINKLLFDYVNTKQKYYMEGISVLRYFPEYENDLRRWLNIFGKENPTNAYSIFHSLNTMNQNKYPIDDEQYFDAKQELSHADIDAILLGPNE